MRHGTRNLPDYEKYIGHTFGSMLENVAEEVPNKEALVFKDKRIIYSEFLDSVVRMAIVLKTLGIKRGDCVGVLFENCVEFFYVQQAILYIGAIFIPLSTRYRKYELTYMLKHSDAKCIFSVEKYLGTNFCDILKTIKKELPLLKNIVIKGETVPKWAESFKDLYEAAKIRKKSEFTWECIEPDSIASILYTSGSTGTPKGVMSSHEAMIWDSTRVCERLKIGSDDVFLMMLPCSHIFATFVLYTNAVMSHSKIVIMESFKADQALQLQQEEGVTILYGVPTMFTLMLNHPDFNKYDLSANRTGYMSGASCPVELIRAVMQKLNCNISAAYGMSEGACITITEYEDDEYVKATTSGVPIRGLDLKIVDHEGKKVDQGVVGEITIKGKNLFLGYYKQPELTKEAFDEEGYFYTGDLGKLDENKRLILISRKKDMIIRGGFNVYPAEVEEQIGLINGIDGVAVVGISDKKLGEKICACVVAKDKSKNKADEIIAFCKEHMANYKVPDVIEFMSSFPLTSSEKIQKFKIKEMIAEKYSDSGVVQ